MKKSLFLFFVGKMLFDISAHFAYSKNLFNVVDFSQEKNIKQLRQISEAHSQCLIQIQKQLSENQRNIDFLRGQIQDMQHDILNIKNSKSESKLKINQALNNQKNCINKNNVNNVQEYSNFKYEKNKIIDNLKKTTDEIEYKKSVSLVLEKKKYDHAIKSFQNFITTYPESIYQANAHYWIGQLYYNQGDKNKASYYFAAVAKNYPKSLKAPDALLKIGIIMQETKQYDKARTIYRQIEKLYPNSASSKQAYKHLSNL